MRERIRVLVSCCPVVIDIQYSNDRVTAGGCCLSGRLVLVHFLRSLSIQYLDCKLHMLIHLSVGSAATASCSSSIVRHLAVAVAVAVDDVSLLKAE